jgi:hypothetical protein
VKGVKWDAWMNSLWAQTFCLRGDDSRTHFWKRRGRKMKGWAATLWTEDAGSDNGALIIPQGPLPTSMAPIPPSLGASLTTGPISRNDPTLLLIILIRSQRHCTVRVLSSIPPRRSLTRATGRVRRPRLVPFITPFYNAHPSPPPYARSGWLSI